MATLLLVLLSISLASGFDYYKRCLLFNKTCKFTLFSSLVFFITIVVPNLGVSFCPKFMHPYHTRCDKDTMSQRTCEIPTVYPLGYTCGWSRCDCNGNLYLDVVTHLCVPLDLCPAAVHKKPAMNSVRARKRVQRRKSSKIIVPDEVDLVDMID